MNNADISAARRLIAQFEGRALGRHNSNEWQRPDEFRKSTDAPVERFGGVVIRRDWSECRRGEYAWSLPGNPDGSKYENFFGKLRFRQLIGCQTVN